MTTLNEGASESPGVASITVKGVQAKTWAQRAVDVESDRRTRHHWARAEPMPFPSFVIGEQVKSPDVSAPIWAIFAAATPRH
jgi:hypothetical protein